MTPMIIPPMAPPDNPASPLLPTVGVEVGLAPVTATVVEATVGTCAAGVVTMGPVMLNVLERVVLPRPW